MVTLQVRPRHSACYEPILGPLVSCIGGSKCGVRLRLHCATESQCLASIGAQGDLHLLRGGEGRGSKLKQVVDSDTERTGIVGDRRRRDSGGT